MRSRITLERMSMETLKEIRKKLGLTQVQAAQKVGVSRRTYQTYEESNQPSLKYADILYKLKNNSELENSSMILSRRFIKKVSSEIFANCPEVECAYLFGSYARNEATSESDVDFLIVAPKLEGFSFSGLHHDLRKAFNKDVDLINFTTLAKSERMLRDILKQGVKIYG